LSRLSAGANFRRLQAETSTSSRQGFYRLSAGSFLKSGTSSVRLRNFEFFGAKSGGNSGVADLGWEFVAI